MSPCEGSRPRAGLSEGGDEGSASPWQRNPPCLPQASLRRAPSGAAPVPAAGGGARPARAAGAGSSRGSRSGRRWQRRLRRGRHSPTWLPLRRTRTRTRTRPARGELSLPPPGHWYSHCRPMRARRCPAARL